jgi:hypothetical protein
MRWLPRNWNDVLSIAVIVGMPIYWWAAAPNEMVIGATIAGFTLCVQYYFRRAPEGPNA